MSINVPPSVELICYADDLAVSITANDPDELIAKGNESLHAIRLWMQRNELEVAPEKTEAIVLNNKRKIEKIVFDYGGIPVHASKEVKYLGITIDRGLHFGKHVLSTCEKAQKTAKALRCLLPNIRGPTSEKRKVLAGTIQSIILYGAPIWEVAMDRRTHRDRVRATQRIMALSICSAYRTASTDAVLVIAGLIPVNLLAKERKRLYDLRRKVTDVDRREERKRTYEDWQREWDDALTGRWTHLLIPDVEPWVKRRHGRVSFYMTQCLTGHGVFSEYTTRIGKRDDPKCRYCEARDGPEHTIFHCPRWSVERQNLKEELHHNITPHNIIEMMLKDEGGWNTVERFLDEIMSRKESDELEITR